MLPQTPNTSSFSSSCSQSGSPSSLQVLPWPRVSLHHHSPLQSSEAREGSLPNSSDYSWHSGRCCGGKDCSKLIWETLTGCAQGLYVRAVPGELDLSLAWH